MTRTRAFGGLVLLGLVLGGAGCAALPLAAVGAALDMTSSAVSTGNEIYRLGKLDTAEMASPDDAVDAAHEAASDLSLRLCCAESKKHDVRRLTFVDARCATLKVDVEPRTANLVRLRINVGWFGDQSTARLFLARMRAHLPKPALPSPPETQEMRDTG